MSIFCLISLFLELFQESFGLKGERLEQNLYMPNASVPNQQHQNTKVNPQQL